MSLRTNRPESAMQDLTPRKAVIVVGAGGTGAKCVTEVARALEAMGEKFGKPIGETGAIVHALVIDGDEKTWKETDDNPDAAVLNRSGAIGLHLFDNQQPEFIRRHNLADIATPELHSAADPQGCNADPRSSRIRYLAQRSSADAKKNPRLVFEDIARSLINLNSGVSLGEVVEIVFVGGMHGGTGPVALDAAADARAIFDNYLGQGASTRAIRTFAYMMTSESAELDRAMGSNPVQTAKRRRNAAVTGMRFDEATVTGGVTLMDGLERIDGVPIQYLHTVNGRSGDRAVNDHYAPIRMVARVIVSQILERGGVDSAVSNVELGILEPEQEMKRLPKNRIAMGLSELMANPDRGALRYLKQVTALNEATGVDTVDETEMKARLAQMNIGGMLTESTRSVEEQKPSIEESEFGDVKLAKANVARVVAEFKGSLPAYKTALRGSVSAPLKAVWTAVETASNDLQNQKKVGTLVATMDAAAQSLAEEVARLQGLIESAREEVKTQENLLDQATERIQNVEFPRFFWSESDKNGVRAVYRTVIAAADRLASAVERLTAAEAMLATIQRERGLAASISGLKLLAHEIKDTVLEVRDGLKPEGSVVSPFDLQVPVATPDFTGVGKTLDPGDYTIESLTALVEGVHLSGMEADLRPYLRDTKVQAELAKRAAPLIIAPSKMHHADKEPFREVTVPVMPEDKFRVGSDGIIKNASEATGVDPKYSVRATTPDGPIVMQERLFGLGALDCAYQRKLIADMIADVLDPVKVKAVEKHFSLKGDMERLLPVYADAIAEDELARDGGNGQIVEKPIAGTDVMVRLYKTKAELDREARLEAARAPKK